MSSNGNVLKNLLTREQVAELLHVEPRTVDTMRRRGDLPTIPLNPNAYRKKNYRFSESAVNAWLLNNQN
jgi:hypothetical protein